MLLTIDSFSFCSFILFELQCWFSYFLHRQHFLHCQQGFMGKHFEKLVQCDPRLNFLSQQQEIILESPYFEQRVSAFSDLHESGKGLDSEVEDKNTVFSLREAGQPSGVLLSSLNNECQGFLCQTPENISHETSSTSLGKIIILKLNILMKMMIRSYGKNMPAYYIYTLCHCHLG